jgi:histidinol-phosphate aminotransferase
MVTELGAVPGVHVHIPAAAPYLLLRVPGGERVRTALRRGGIAVRRADTFPGLTPDHLRVTVRPPEVATVLVAALSAALVEVPV